MIEHFSIKHCVLSCSYNQQTVFITKQSFHHSVFIINQHLPNSHHLTQLHSISTCTLGGPSLQYGWWRLRRPYGASIIFDACASHIYHCLSLSDVSGSMVHSSILLRCSIEVASERCIITLHIFCIENGQLLNYN